MIQTRWLTVIGLAMIAAILTTIGLMEIWEPILVWLGIAAAVGVLGVTLVIAAFVLVARKGGWAHAMQSIEGRWSPPHRLMFVGVLLGTIGVVLTLILFVVLDTMLGGWRS